MTRFYDVEVLSVDPEPAPFAASYFTRKHTHLSSVVDSFVRALKTKGEKVPKGSQLEWLQRRAKDVDLSEVLDIAAAGFVARTQRVRGKKRVVASLAAALQDPGDALMEVYASLDDEEDLIRPHFFLHYNMCAFLRPEVLPPIHEPEVVLDVRGRTSPEGAIPATSFEFLRGWIVRHLRDHDQKPNPWLKAHSVDDLQGHHPKGLAHVFVGALEERTKKRALTRFIAPRAWVSHLEPGDTFASAA